MHARGHHCGCGSGLRICRDPSSGISAKQLQRQLGLSRYETAWLILQKLRRAMVAPEREPLKREIEVDEFFLGGEEAGLSGGRARGKKALVGVAIEVRGAGSGRLRLQTLKRFRGITRWLRARDDRARHDRSHRRWPSYNCLDKLGYQHHKRSQRQNTTGELLLPRAHRAVSNLKAWMHGTHRSVSDPHLQTYLDEYVFRHNRRNTPMAAFQTLLGLTALHEPTTYSQITRRAA